MRKKNFYTEYFKNETFRYINNVRVVYTRCQYNH